MIVFNINKILIKFIIVSYVRIIKYHKIIFVKFVRHMKFIYLNNKYAYIKIIIYKDVYIMMKIKYVNNVK